VFSRLQGPQERYLLHEPYRITLPVTHRELFVVGGFTWDGGSVPRIFWRVSHPQEFSASFLCHDALYAAELLPRRQADDELYELIRLEGGSWLQRYLIYRAVRMGGYFVWENHRPAAVRRSRRLCSLDVPPPPEK
jgi:hypothetical protein